MSGSKLKSTTTFVHELHTLIKHALGIVRLIVNEVIKAKKGNFASSKSGLLQLISYPAMILISV